jgi:hypothetical protein
VTGHRFDTDDLGRTVVDPLGDRIGEIATLYSDVDTGVVSFGGVSMLRRGRRRVVLVSFVDATLSVGSIAVKCGRELARRAPSVRPGDELAADGERALFAHYDLPYAADTARRRLAPFPA